jgi:hypothetical protein
MADIQKVKRHAGRYFSRKNAESLANYMRNQDKDVQIVEATCYDVIVTEHMEVME